MDFLYTDLNEIVDPCAYEVVETDGTVRLDIDNDKRTISASVRGTNGKLFVEDIVGKDK
jgi:hypothetical protein